MTDPRTLLRYDPCTGWFCWRDDVVARGRRIAGKRAGSVNGHGYREIKVDGVSYLEHRLAWLFVTGAWPERDIDHKDTVKTHNAFSNLRPCTDSQNGGNQKIAKNNTSGFKGVYLNRATGRWRAMVRVNRILIRIGTFAKREEAAEAAQQAREEHFGEFARAA